MENTELLKRIFLFHEFSTMELLQINKVIESKKVAAGEMIIRQNNPGDTMYILKSGTVEVVCDVGGREINLATMNAIDHFGEMALLGDDKRSASVRAVTPCEILLLLRVDLQRILEHSTEVSSKFYKAIAEVLASRLRDSNNMVADIRAMVTGLKTE